MKGNDLSLNEVKQLIIPTLRQHGVSHAAIFGSFVHGEQREDSDVDILIDFNSEKGLFDLIGLKLKLEEVLGRTADVVTYNSLSHLIKDNVLKEQVILF